MLCVLDAEIWIIRVLHVSFKKETFPPCEPGADLTDGFLFGKKGVSGYLFYAKKWKGIIYSEQLLNIMSNRLLYKV